MYVNVAKLTVDVSILINSSNHLLVVAEKAWFFVERNFQLREERLPPYTLRSGMRERGELCFGSRFRGGRLLCCFPCDWSSESVEDVTFTGFKVVVVGKAGV